ncbi:epimerase [Streptomyces alfalfae]|uniref:Epimerase n=1 Tax=Streptomyces alfalfae TaxID=1642299 RepID=A0ABM6GSY6_9ACTN|nr:NAD(P)H-binding protein [Streptomyces alfalfae]APY86897.1 epimerase [Streptomyces alfalfae]AYA17291.1 NAD-dependent epimerase/dehydratase family protein [Streptomyces fradiae]RXX37201.1 epimerase [Streptomyces alfalfae]RZM83646.1 NAD-dependent epimerase/dehydratase family protein [Streptomyces alfalfae]
MKLTVFGATGGIGGEIVRQALTAGHRVTAVVRDPARLTAEGAGLEVFRADLTDPEALRAAVAGRDAVLSGLGARKRADAGVATALTRSVLRAMDAEAVRRIVVVSAAPVGPPADRQPLADRAMLALVGAVLKGVYLDLRGMEAELSRSATDWTSVRPPRLQDKPLTGIYRKVVGGTPRSGRFIGRADVAHAMLAVVGDPATVKQGVGVAY